MKLKKSKEKQILLKKLWNNFIILIEVSESVKYGILWILYLTGG